MGAWSACFDPRKGQGARVGEAERLTWWRGSRATCSRAGESGRRQGPHVQDRLSESGNALRRRSGGLPAAADSVSLTDRHMKRIPGRLVDSVVVQVRPVPTGYRRLMLTTMTEPLGVVDFGTESYRDTLRATTGSTVPSRIRSSSAVSGMRTWRPTWTKRTRRSATRRRGNRTVVPSSSAACLTESSCSMIRPPAAVDGEALCSGPSWCLPSVRGTMGSPGGCAGNAAFS